MRRRRWPWVVVALLAVAAAVPIARNAEWTTLDATVRQELGGDYVSLSQGVVHYEIAGPADGQPVVLVHGFSVPSYIWGPTFDALANAGFRTIRFDLYGRGLSDRPEGPYDRARFVRQIADLLDATGAGGPADIVGLSMGGAIAAAFVADHPDRVRRVVLLDPLAPPRDIGPMAWPVIGDYLFRAWFLPSLPERQTSDFVDASRFARWGDQFRPQMRYRGYGRAILSTVRHFLQSDSSADYRALGASGRPILLIWGVEDQTVPFANSEALRARIGEHEFLAVPEAGHLPHLERPELVEPRLIGFLRGQQ